MPHFRPSRAALRRLPQGADVPVLMVTGRVDFASIQRAYEVGATDFATKPVQWPILCHRLRYMLRAGDTFTQLRESEVKLANAQRRLWHGVFLAQLSEAICLG